MKNFENYEKKMKKWIEKHEKIITIIHLTILLEFREHVKNHINTILILTKLLKQYEITNLIIINIFFQEICRSNMNDYKSINEYVEHIQRHYNKIFAIDKIIKSWILNICFRMSLSTHFNFYIFQLIHAAKTSDIEFIIDDMTTILMKKTKRSNYIEEKTETTRAAKNTSRDDDDETKFNSSNNNKFSNKKNRDKKFCFIIDCDNEYHDDKHCFYAHSNKREKNWKSFELKLNIIKNWYKIKNFIFAIKRQKELRENNIQKTIKKMKNILSLIFSVFFSFSVTK